MKPYDLSHKLSFFSDPALKSEALSNMQDQLLSGDTRRVSIRGVQCPLFAIGWAWDDVTVSADALGLPPDLLSLGYKLFDELPEGLEACKAFIRMRMDMITAFPVGADFADRGGLFYLEVLRADRYTLHDKIHDTATAHLAQELKTTLEIDPLGGLIKDDLRGRIRATISAETERRRQLWQKERSHDPKLNENLQALEVLRCIGEFPVNPSALADAADELGSGLYEKNALGEDLDGLLRDLFNRVLNKTGAFQM